jgi:demethylmenaquinone methyltransferase/2-methoxy-6-polyprenyl-1,4-benzoquinol methylase
MSDAELRGDAALFDGIADRYDLVNTVVSFGMDARWRARLVRAVGDPGKAPARLLDVATGTGDVALALARAYPETEIIGLDPSRAMLAAAERKLRRARLEARVRFVRGDALALSYPDASFDAATVAFGIRNIPDRPGALAELGRILRPGACLGILELSEPESPIASFHVHRVVPRIGALLSRAPAYAYLSRSIAAFPPPTAFAALLEAAGFTPVRIEPLLFGVAHLYVARRAA